jgi:glycosyltransferase involved in cell wall biosynthesis
MAPLRIVLVMVEPPLPFGDAAARWFYVLLRGLVARGHRVTAFAACSRPGDVEAARALFPAPEYDLRLYPFDPRGRLRDKWETFRRPFSFLFSSALRDDLRATLAGGFDLLHLEQLWTGWLALDHADQVLVNVHYLPSIDMGAAPARSLAARKERWLTFSAERRLVRSFRFFRACTSRLDVAVRAINPRADVATVPFGIDLTLYPYIPDTRRTGAAVVSLIGSMNWGPSRSAAERLLTRLWPAIKQRVPQARLQIVGRRARTALAAHLGLRDVEVAEDVPETRPYFEEAGVFVYAPARGSGMKVKIQEAMAYGVPVVTTAEGVEGLPAEDGVHAGVCDDDDGLVRRTVDLLGDVDRQNRQRQAARQLIEMVCSPSATLDALEAVYERVLDAGRSGTVAHGRPHGGLA